MLRPLAEFLFAISIISAARAEPITYLWTSTASGVFSGAPFASASVTIAVYADTQDVKTLPDGTRYVAGRSVVSVAGVCYGTYTSDLQISCNEAAISLDDIFSNRTGDYAAYDLKSTIARRSYVGSGVPYSAGGTNDTSAGPLAVRHISSIGFEAQLGPHLPPSFTTNVQPISVVEGVSPRFAVSLGGTRPLDLQWFKDGVPISGARFSSLTISNATVADSGDYVLVVTNLFGRAESEKATLTVSRSAPVIVTPPLSQGARPGSAISLNVAAVGTSPFTYQWFHNDVPIANATASSIELSSIAETNIGAYRVEITNPLGATMSPPAVIDWSRIISWGLSPGHLPVDSGNVISITGGDRHHVLRRADGKVESWGDNERGQASAPTYTDFTSIAAGSAHSIGVRANGEVELWGQFFSLLEDVPPQTSTNIALVGMGVGAQHALSLTTQGRVVAWGAHATNQVFLEPPPAATNIVAVAAGSYHSLALRSDGRVLAWGLPRAGSSTNVPLSATGIVAIATGWFHNAALRSDGRVITWPGTSVNISNVVDLACGAHHTLALTTAGQVRSFGSSSDNLHIVPAAATNAAAVAAGAYTAFALLGDGPPKFNTVAMNRSVEMGSNAYFRMWAIGAQPITYQWSFNGTPMPGATNSWLCVTNVQANNAGAYVVTARNHRGSITSAEMFLNESRPEFINVTKTESGFVIELKATQQLQLEFKNSLSESEWQPLRVIAPGSSTVTLQAEEVASPTSARFFQLREL